MQMRLAMMGQPPNTPVKDAGTTFSTVCTSCRTELDGYLIRQQLLAPAEIVGMFGGLIAERTARSWMRAWCPSGALPGRRHPVVAAHDFVLAFEAHKLPYRGRGVRPGLPKLQTKCHKCGRIWGGFVARLAVRGVQQVLPEIGGGFLPDDVAGWIGSGRLRAYRVPGIRGPVFDPREFEADFADLRAKYLQRRRLGQLTDVTSSPAKELGSDKQ